MRRRRTLGCKMPDDEDAVDLARSSQIVCLTIDLETLGFGYRVLEDGREVPATGIDHHLMAQCGHLDGFALAEVVRGSEIIVPCIVDINRADTGAVDRAQGSVVDHPLSAPTGNLPI